MVDEHIEYIRAICSAPEDDNVRLAYADWLSMHGQPNRGEFIRLQIARAVELGPDKDPWDHMTIGERELLYGDRDPDVDFLVDQDLGDDETRWVLDVIRTVFCDPNDPDKSPTRNDRRIFQWIWRRGFIDEITIGGSDWYRCGNRLSWRPNWRQSEITDATHPIRVVNLIRWPGVRNTPDTSYWYLSDLLPNNGGSSAFFLSSAHDFRQRGAQCVKNHWPGVVFTLPPKVPRA